MNIVSLLGADTIAPDLSAKSKSELLNKLIDLLSHKVSAEELEKIRDAVFEREKIMSTGVGKGLAIPHGKSPGIKDNYAAFAVLDEPIEYEALDKKPVNLVFLLAGPQSSSNMHIKMLSRISRLMNNDDFRERLLNCDTAEEILATFEQEENVHFGG